MTGNGTPLRQHAELLYQASLEFNSTLDLDELLPRLFERTLEILDAAAGSIWLRRDGVLVCHLARGPAGGRLEGLELPFGAGIVGAVAQEGETELVADARSDPRFVHQVDEVTGFETRSILAAPLISKGEVLGVFQLLNKRSEDGRFDEDDAALLSGLAATAGMALRNAQLHDAEKQARDLKALARVSRELASTLDTERLVLSIVNLGSQALQYDRAAIVLDDRGSLELRAVSGRKPEESEESDEDLERLIVWLAERGETVYVPDLEDDDDIAEAVRTTFGESLRTSGTRSLCCVRLEDEEGRLGALYLESARPDFLEAEGLEMVDLLANQSAVALRNAELYGQVPFIGVVERFASWRRRLTAAPSRHRRGFAIAAVIALAVLLFPWRERVGPEESRLLPGSREAVRATVAGLVDRVRVREGQRVETREVVAELREDGLRVELVEASTALEVARRDAATARARGDLAAARVAELRTGEAGEWLDVLDQRLDRTRLQTTTGGVVMTTRPELKVGEWLRPGETFVTVGRTDLLEIESRVSQRDIGRVRPGQPMRVRVAARPDLTFVGEVISIAAHADSAPGREPTFVVRGRLENTEQLLRPGMEAKVKIVGRRRPLGVLLTRPLLDWTRMRLWR